MSWIIGSNVRVMRAYWMLTQKRLAARMAALGCPWTQRTVSELEAGNRDVTATEWLCLALALETDMMRLTRGVPL